MHDVRHRKCLIPPLASNLLPVMKRSISLSIVALLSGVIVSSCVPYDEYGRRIDTKKKPKPRTTVTDPKQQEIDAKREELRLKEEERKKQLGQSGTSEGPTGTTGDFNPSEGTVDPPKPSTPPRNHPVAAAVPGKPGFVFSPFNNKVVDVRGIASGTLVADPQYPASEKKHFRVP